MHAETEISEFLIFCSIQIDKSEERRKKISTGGLLSCQLTSAGQAALVGRSAGKGKQVTQKATSRSQFFFFPAFNYFSRAKYQIFRDFTLGMYRTRATISRCFYSKKYFFALILPHKKHIKNVCLLGKIEGWPLIKSV